MSINYLDIALVVVLLYFAAKGFRKGFFHELVGFIGVLFALALSLRALEPLAPAVSDLFGLSAGKSAVLVFFFVFSSILFVLKYAETWVHKHATLRLADALNKAAGDTISSMQDAEKLSVSALQGGADMREVIDAVMDAEQSLRAAISIRDKIVQSYLEVSRMPI